MQEAENNHDAIEQAAVEPQAQEHAPEVRAEEDPGAQAKNFRELRRIVKDQQHRIRELEAQRAAPQPQYEEPEEEEVNLSDDDIPSWGQVQKAIDKRAERKAREMRQQDMAELAEDRTRLRFKDYDDVVTEENVVQLVDDDPVLANAIRNAPNPYEAAYKLIKKSAFFKEQSAAKASPIAKKIDENAAKPRSTNSIQAERPLAAAHSFASMSNADREALWREMRDCATRRS